MENWLLYLGLFSVGAAVVGFGVAALVFWSFNYCMGLFYANIKPHPPTTPLQKQQPLDRCSLFRYIPEIRGKIAWQDLAAEGTGYPTPVHAATLPLPIYGDEEAIARKGEKVTVYLKREDLSSSRYGGNKVRTLEFQLPCAVASLLTDEKKKGGKVIAMGAPGSNQLVATAVHGETCEAPVRLMGIFPEGSSKDSGLNIVTSLSLPRAVAEFPFRNPVTYLIDLYRLAWINSKNAIMPNGGATPCGAVGHTAAIFELNEQINKGMLPDPDAIFLPFGSGCTTAGLLAGVCLLRKMRQLKGEESEFVNFHKSNFKIHSVYIHPIANANPATTKRKTKKLMIDCLNVIKSLGGPDATDQIESVFANYVPHNQYIGAYGTHSDESRKAKFWFEKNATIKTTDTSNAAKPWWCSCFGSKACAAMLDYLADHPNETVIYWSTKSVIQPFGKNDGLEIAKSTLNNRGLQWLKSCSKEKIDLNTGEGWDSFDDVVKHGRFLGH